MLNRKKNRIAKFARFRFALPSLSVRFTFAIEKNRLLLHNLNINITIVMKSNKIEKIIRAIIAIASALLGVAGGSAL